MSHINTSRYFEDILIRTNVSSLTSNVITVRYVYKNFSA